MLMLYLIGDQMSFHEIFDKFIKFILKWAMRLQISQNDDLWDYSYSAWQKAIF